VVVVDEPRLSLAKAAATSDTEAAAAAEAADAAMKVVRFNCLRSTSRASARIFPELCRFVTPSVLTAAAMPVLTAAAAAAAAAGVELVVTLWGPSMAPSLVAVRGPAPPQPSAAASEASAVAEAGANIANIGLTYA